MKNGKFLHRLLAMLVAALVLCTSVSVLAPHAHAEAVKSPDAGEIPDPGCSHDRVTSFYYFDKEYHWYFCLDCNEHVNEEAHVFEGCDGCVCGASKHTIVDGKCEICGEDCPHAYYHEEYDMDKHWVVCDDCDKAFYDWMATDKHQENCTNPGVCWDCGATGVNFSLTVHDRFDWEKVLSDDTHHWFECLDCGGQAEKQEHYAECSNEKVCVACGVEGTMAEVMHAFGGRDTCEVCGATCDHPEIIYRGFEDYHYQICVTCGKESNFGDHSVLCSDTDAGVCYECGVEYADDCYLRIIHNMENGICTICNKKCTHSRMEMRYDDKNHWGACADCGTIFEAEFPVQPHRISCAYPGVCYECETTGVTGEIEHSDVGMEFFHDDTHHWFICNDCGEEAWKEEHLANCEDDSFCWACGAEGPITNLEHYYQDGVCQQCGVKCEHPAFYYDFDNSKHHKYCSECDAYMGVSAHIVVCTNPDDDKCYECRMFYSSNYDVIYRHEGEAVYAYDKTNHWFTCSACNQALTEAEAHTSSGAATCTVSETCTVCETVLVAANGHRYFAANVVEATCTKGGYTEYCCAMCGDTYIVDSKPIGHYYPKDAKFASLNNGYHGIPCQHGCGEQMSEKCTMATVTVGPLSYSMCSVCGYVEKNEAAPIAPVIVTNVVENAVVELAQPVEGAPVELIVHEQQVMAPAVEGVEELKVALRVFNVMMVNDAGVEQKLAGKATIKIPCEAMENVRLVLIKEDGTMVELAFEIKDGLLVFETEEIGVFALLPLVA